MLKKFIILFFLFSFFPGKIYAEKASVVIINQIRGTEACCQPGNLDLSKEIVNDSYLKDLPLSWALRFDALINKNYLINYSVNDELGLLLEITPDLATKSGVIYKGKVDGSDWYYAKNSLLVGYTIEERKKLIDTLFSSFKKEFGDYPKFTVSWMIDAWSLNYINKIYNVKLHEITKEQYETDSYTLYGGIFNYPYFPSSDHPLIPGNLNNQLDLLIVRQTVSDLIQNYGSAKAYFTSQPNDYLSSPDKPDFSYFKDLLDNALDQSFGHNFALLGFENSFSWNIYGSEFIKQLELIAQYQKKGKIIVQKAGDYYINFTKTVKENKAFYLKQFFSSKSNNGVLWYFGKNYRARIIINQGKVVLDDLRTFINFSDPYKNIPAKADYAYWIIPYLIDGSQQYQLSPKQEELIKKKELNYNNTLSDQYSTPFGIVLGGGSFSLTEKEEEIEIIFTGDKKGKVIFNPENIFIEKSLSPYFNRENNIYFNDIIISNTDKKISFNKHFDFLIKKSKTGIDLGWEYNNRFFPLFELISREDNLSLVPKTQINNREELVPLFQPDKSELPVDKEKSIYYWNNKKAVINRNPVRLFILPLNKIGRSTSISRIEIISSQKDELKIAYPIDYSYRVSPWFIDITSELPGKKNFSLVVDGVEVIHDIQIEFITDCRKNFTSCLTSPVQTIKYVVVILNEQKNRLSSFLPKIWKR